MRAILAVLAILLLAGCLETTTYPPDVGAPTPNATSTTTTTPTPGGDALVKPAHGENLTEGFRLVGDESASGFIPGGEVEFVFTGTNEGGPAMALADPCGGGNPKIHIEDENGTRLALWPPAMRCMTAAGFVASEPGARYAANLSWNGTVYDGEVAREVADGTYHAVGTFTAQRGDAPVDIVVKIPVHVFRTRGIG